jgi:molecular chaperone GrpE (heat shock protein)
MDRIHELAISVGSIALNGRIRGIRSDMTDPVGKDVSAARARRKLADAEQENQRASAALKEALANTKAMIDEANKQAQDTDATALLAELLTEEEVQKVRHDSADFAKRLLADVDAARDEMNARFAKAIAADENAG